MTIARHIHMSKWQSALALTVLVLAGAAVGCRPANQYAPPPPPEVTTAQPVTQDIVDYLEFTGYTKASEMVEVRGRVAGYLKSVEFVDGAMVKQNDLLFTIEPEPFEIALASAKAALQKAEAALSLAESELKRTEPLVAKGALPQQELDTKLADKATADANVASAKADVNKAEWNLSYTKIRAPISGRVSRRMVDTGNLVQAESTLLTRIENLVPIYGYFTVSENDLLRLRAAQDAAAVAAPKKRSEGPEVLLGLSNEQGYPHKGRLDFEETGVDQATGTQMRRGVFSNEDLQLIPGMFVRYRFPIGHSKPQLLVSDRAIGADQRGDYVLVVNEKDKNTVEYRPVQLGIRVNGMRVIKSGLESGEWIVVNGLQRARPGTPVTPKHEQSVAEKPAAPQKGEETKKDAKDAATDKEVSQVTPEASKTTVPR